MRQGRQETGEDLQERGVQLVVRAQPPTECIPELAEDACLTIVDAGHLRVQRQWRSAVTEAVECPLEEVETNLIVPVEEAADQENFSAGTFRPRITSKLEAYLVELKVRKVRRDSLGLRLDGLNLADLD